MLARVYNSSIGSKSVNCVLSYISTVYGVRRFVKKPHNSNTAFFTCLFFQSKRSCFVMLTNSIALFGVLTCMFFLSFFEKKMFAQHANIWKMSDQLALNFSTKSETLPTFESSMIQHSLSDNAETFVGINEENGKNIFYLDAQRLYGRASRLVNTYNQTMHNSDGIFACSNIGSGAMILPVPGHPKQYYLFTICPKNGGYTLYSANNTSVNQGVISQALVEPPLVLYRNTIDMTDPAGKVIEKNTLIYEKPLCEKLAAVKHSNNKDWWLILHELGNSNFVKLKITGKHKPETKVQEIGKPHKGFHARQGEMIFSENGLILGLVTRQGVAELFDFNRCDGSLQKKLYVGQNNLSHSITKLGGEAYYGASFSPDNNWFYFSTGYKLIQVNVNAHDGFSEKKIIWEDTLLLRYPLAQHQLAPDGRIYIAVFGSGYLAVINDPNKSGKKCHFLKKGFYLDGKRSKAGLPNYPNYQLVAPISDIAGRDTAICPGGKVKLGRQNNIKHLFQWLPTTGLSSDRVAIPIASPKQTTTYTLAILDKTLPSGCDTLEVSTVTVKILSENQAPCDKKSSYQTVKINNSDINKTTPELNLTIYPNPADDFVYMNFKSNTRPVMTLHIFSSEGNKVQTHKIYPSISDFEIVTKDLPSGNYSCKFFGENNNLISNYRLTIRRDK